MSSYASGILIKPTSIAQTGTSASINTDGSVSFTACSTLSLNGVFSATYDNYTVVIRSVASSATAINVRLRNSGIDATGSNYLYELFETTGLVADGTTYTQDKCRVCNASTGGNGDVVNLYGPYLAQPTLIRNTGVSSQNGAGMVDVTARHGLSTEYDGFTFFPDSPATISGRVAVYGMRK